MNLNVYTLPVGELDTNCHILYSDNNDKALIIDPGGDFFEIEGKLKALNKSAGAVILTHCHYDHIGTLNGFEKMGVPVYIGKNEVKNLNSPVNLANWFGVEFKSKSAVNELIEGDIQICGFNLSIIFTPGHTNGSICIIAGQYMLTGDTLFCGSYGRTDFPTGSEEQLIKSAKKILSLDKNYILLTGHGDNTTLFNERKNNYINFLITDKLW